MNTGLTMVMLFGSVIHVKTTVLLAQAMTSVYHAMLYQTQASMPLKAHALTIVVFTITLMERLASTVFQTAMFVRTVRNVILALISGT